MDIFSKIAAGEIPSYKCAESEKFVSLNSSSESESLGLEKIISFSDCIGTR